MKFHLLAPVILTALSAIPAAAQTHGAKKEVIDADRSGVYMLNWTSPPGQPLLLRLNENLDTKKARAGDRVTAQVIMALAGDGTRLKKSILIGHVTEASAFSRQSRARIGIVFDQIRSPDGSIREFNGRLQALGIAADPTPREICYPGAEGGPYTGCSDLPWEIQLTKETVGIFNLDDSFDLHDFLYNQVIASNRKNFKLRAGTRMVIIAQVADTAPVQ